MTARLNYLAQDRPDIGYAVKEACREMAKPSKGAWKKLKRIVGFVKKYPRVVQLFRHQRMPVKITATVDPDHAKCKSTRKSTSGGLIRLGAHTLKHWSSTQSVIALSSGEAEYYSIVKGVSGARYMQSIATDLGLPLGLEVETDSSAAMAIAMREGVGKAKHLQTVYLWLQDLHAREGLEVTTIAGTRNAADLLTKHLG